LLKLLVINHLALLLDGMIHTRTSDDHYASAQIGEGTRRALFLCLLLLLRVLVAIESSFLLLFLETKKGEKLSALFSYGHILSRAMAQQRC